ncbi:MAG: sporulation integral membrane protein YtvI [Firmicutes bacterium]|nr:sporulation integral membrane protein YtvI [Bacillota bacterium]
MKLPPREKLTSLLLLLGCILVGLAAFVLLCEYGLRWLGVAVRGLGLIALPFIIAWLLARLTRPLVSFLKKRLRLPAGVSALVITLLVLAVTAGLIWLLYAIALSLLTEVSSLLADADDLLADFYAQAEQFCAGMGLDFELIQEQLGRGTEQLSDLALRLLRAMINLAASTPQLLIIFFITLIATYYWCRDAENVDRMICHMLPGRGGAIYRQVTEIVHGYARLILILMLVAMIISAGGLLICGVEKPLRLGILIGCLNIAPSIGPAVILIPWALWSLIEGRTMLAVGLLVMWGLIVVSRYLILPRLMDSSQGIHPLATLASLFVGLMLFGVVGIVLGPVILAIGLSLFRQLRNRSLLTAK